MPGSSPRCEEYTRFRSRLLPQPARGAQALLAQLESPRAAQVPGDAARAVSNRASSTERSSKTPRAATSLTIGPSPYFSYRTSGRVWADNAAATAAAAAEECTSPKMQPASSLAPAGRSLLFGGLANLFGTANHTCADEDESCAQWARDGECRKNAAFMTQQCAASCGTCGEAAASAPGRQLCHAAGTPRTRSCADEAERPARARRAASAT